MLIKDGTIVIQDGPVDGGAHKDIYAAMLAVYKKVGYVQKTSRNDHLKYKYAGEADLIEALRPAMVENGIIIYPSSATVDIGAYDQNGKHTNRVVGQYAFTFLHAETGTSITVAAIGEGVDNGDKAAYKSATGALKYALRQAFLIETGDEPEKDESTDRPIKTFSSSAKRRDFEAKLVDLMRGAPSLDDLKGIWKEAHPTLETLRTSGEEYESVSYEYLLDVKNQVKDSLMGRVD